MSTKYVHYGVQLELFVYLGYLVYLRELVYIVYLDLWLVHRSNSALFPGPAHEHTARYFRPKDHDARASSQQVPFLTRVIIPEPHLDRYVPNEVHNSYTSCQRVHFLMRILIPELNFNRNLSE